jgi:hypothetical protein
LLPAPTGRVSFLFGHLRTVAEAMANKRGDLKAVVDVVRKILIAEWEPIGSGVPEDECDSYIPVIYRLMRGRGVP